MLRALDFVLLMAVITVVNIWNDGNKTHIWILCVLIAATNIVGYISGLKRR